MATFPTGVKQFANSNHIDGIDIAPHINDIQDEIKAIETALTNGNLGAIYPDRVHVGGASDPGDNNLVVDGTTNLIGALSLNGTLITPSPRELNLVHKYGQNITDAGTTAINIKNGVVCLKATDVINATLANPTDGSDDGSRLLILSETAKAHTVTVTDGFGNGGGGEDVATFGAIGDTLELMAYNGYWYIVGSHQVTVA